MCVGDDGSPVGAPLVCRLVYVVYEVNDFRVVLLFKFDGFFSKDIVSYII